MNDRASAEGLREAAQAVVDAAEPDEGFEGWVDYLVPFDVLDTLRAALRDYSDSGDIGTDRVVTDR